MTNDESSLGTYDHANLYWSFATEDGRMPVQGDRVLWESKAWKAANMAEKIGFPNATIIAYDEDGYKRKEMSVEVAQTTKLDTHPSGREKRCLCKDCRTYAAAG